MIEYKEKIDNLVLAIQETMQGMKTYIDMECSAIEIQLKDSNLSDSDKEFLSKYLIFTLEKVIEEFG